MTNTHESRTGAATTRRLAKSNLLELLVAIKENEPQLSKHETYIKWRAEIIDNPEDVDAALLYCFANFWEAVTRVRPPRRPFPTKLQREKQIAEVRDKIIRKVIGLAFIMPDGRALANWTGSECVKYGGQFTRMGEQAGQKTIGIAFKTDAALWRAMGIRPNSS